MLSVSSEEKAAHKKKISVVHEPPTWQDTELPLTRQGLGLTTSPAGDRQRICKTLFLPP